MRFRILKKSKTSRARRGVIETAHGEIETPAFVPVATQAAIKGIAVEQMKVLGASSVLCNTYHLYLRPGDRTIKQLGGLHRFMNWNRPIWTDSGGFQVFSLGFGLEHGVGKIANIFPGEKTGILSRKPAVTPPSPKSLQRPSKTIAGEGFTHRATTEGELEHLLPRKTKLMRVKEDGVEFNSHLDGSKHFLTPERSIKIQENLGADLIFAFDECTSPLHDYKYTKVSLARTHRWAKRSLAAFHGRQQALYGIIQGGIFRDLREEATKFIAGLDFEGIGIGGALGKTKKEMHKVLGWIAPLLPDHKPRHLLGIGSPEDVVQAVKQGLDTFDCVAPTRLGRNGVALVKNGRLNIKSAEYVKDKNPIDKKCGCPTCGQYSRAYLCHLFRANEMLGPILLTVHNLYFMENLFRTIRASIR